MCKGDSIIWPEGTVSYEQKTEHYMSRGYSCVRADGTAFSGQRVQHCIGRRYGVGIVKVHHYMGKVYSLPLLSLQDDEEDFSKSNGFANGHSGFESDPFKDTGFGAPAPPASNDPFAPSGNTQNQVSLL